MGRHHVRPGQGRAAKPHQLRQSETAPAPDGNRLPRHLSGMITPGTARVIATAPIGWFMALQGDRHECASTARP